MVTPFVKEPIITFAFLAAAGAPARRRRRDFRAAPVARPQMAVNSLVTLAASALEAEVGERD
jgi:hypothetical protein